jgi:hypothetical protein
VIALGEPLLLPPVAVAPPRACQLALVPPAPASLELAPAPPSFEPGPGSVVVSQNNTSGSFGAFSQYVSSLPPPKVTVIAVSGGNVPVGDLSANWKSATPSQCFALVAGLQASSATTQAEAIPRLRIKAMLRIEQQSGSRNPTTPRNRAKARRRIPLTLSQTSRH